MRTIIIELNGPIAAGKTTVASYIKENIGDKYKIENLNKKVNDINKIKKKIIYLFFIFRYFKFVFSNIYFIIKKGRDSHNSTWRRVLKINRILLKWALADYLKGVFILDEGITKLIDYNLILKIHPKDQINLIVIYVTADGNTRSARILNRKKNNPNIKKSHKAKINKKNINKRENYWIEISKNYALNKNLLVPCFFVDTSPYMDTDQQLDSLLKFLNREIKIIS